MERMRRLPALLLTLGLLLSACGGQGSWQEQYDLGVRYLSEGNYEEAILAFTAAIEIDPNRAEAYVGRGDAYVASGETEDNLAAALADYEAALERDETLAAAWLGVADIYIRQGDYDRALEVLREGQEKTGGDQSIEDKITEMERGSIKDSAGNVRRMNSYDGDGTLVWYHLYTYDSQGRQASVTSYDAQGTQTGHVDHTYNEAGDQVVSHYYRTATGEVGRLEYEYDSSGRVSKEFHYSLSGELDSYSIREYDSDDHLVREEEYDTEGEMTGYETRSYNAQGQLIRLDSYEKMDTGGTFELFYYQTWEYDSDGRRIAYRQFNPDGTLDWEEIPQYDDSGELLGEDKYDGAGKLISSTVSE